MITIDKKTYKDLMNTDLSEKFFAVIGQKTVIEAMAVGDKDTSFICEVKELFECTSEPNEAQAGDGTSIYYKSSDADELLPFVTKVIMQQKVDVCV